MTGIFDSGLYKSVHYYLVPPVFVVFFTALVQYIAWAARADSGDFNWDVILGNSFSWKFVGILILWAYMSLAVASEKTYGPTTSFGQTPEYQNNGFDYFCIT